MLHRVREYGLKGGESEPGFKPQKIRWKIVFSASGDYLGVEELGGDGKGLPVGKCPTIEKTGDVIWSQFLWSDLRKMLAWDKDAKKQVKAEKCRQFFLERMREAGACYPPLESCAWTLASEDTRQEVIAALKARKAKESDSATVEIGGQLPLESPEITSWWRENRMRIVGLVGSGGKRASSGNMRCLLTGDLTAPARVHPFIAGMSDVGGNAKAALVSFKEPAFWSFGREQSFNAAVSEQAAAEYTDALNQLIERRSRRLISYRYVQQVRKGKGKGAAAEGKPAWAAERAKAGQDAKVVLWFDKPEVNAAIDSDILLAPSPFEGSERREAAQAEQRGLELLTAIQRGQRPDLDGASYFCAVLSAAKARVMVRSWQEGPLTQFANAVVGWFSDLEIVDALTGERGRDPAFARLVGAMGRKKSDVAPSLVLSLWLAAIQQREIPPAVARQVLKRLRVEIVSGESPRQESAALLKAWLLRSAHRKEDQMQSLIEPCLREDHPDPAYQCGRLMAELASLQRSALGDVGAGVVQRYFTSASATPGLVFGRLLRNAQHHLEKLEPRVRWAIEGRIAAITCKIGGRYPASLGLEGQSMFALGYYQQIAEDRRTLQINKLKKEQRANG